MTAPRRCKDCVAAGITTTRQAKFSGPRCYTHHLAFKKASSLRAHARQTQNNFEISGEQYWGLYEFQGGVCWICRRAKGVAKRLAIDHDHSKEGCDHPPERGCSNCIRALLCGPCNELLGRYGLLALQRAIEVLTDPPAQRFLNPPAPGGMMAEFSRAKARMEKIPEGSRPVITNRR